MAKVRGIFCLNSKCEHYFEDSCMKILETDTVNISEAGMCADFRIGKHIGYAYNDEYDSHSCKTCEYWLEKYQKCENPEQPQGEADDYMSPPNRTCDLLGIKSLNPGFREEEREVKMLTVGEWVDKTHEIADSLENKAKSQHAEEVCKSGSL